MTIHIKDLDNQISNARNQAIAFLDKEDAFNTLLTMK